MPSHAVYSFRGPIRLRRSLPIAPRMDQAERYQEWQRNKDRPQYVRAHRDDLAEYLTDGVVAKMPSPGASTWRWRQFLNSHTATVTRQLNPANGDSDMDEDTEAEANA